jgi:hypothetical protein
MTLTTQVRINWPVPAVKLLDHVTLVAEGDPRTVERRSHGPGDPYWEGSTFNHQRHGVRNRAGQGLMTLASIEWGEHPETDAGDDEYPIPVPPALVVLSIDNPYGFGHEDRGRWVQANRILPAVVEWLDGQGVPRDQWWWEDETAGTFHPGTTDVRFLDTKDEREVWTPSEIAPAEGAKPAPAPYHPDPAPIGSGGAGASSGEVDR